MVHNLKIIESKQIIKICSWVSGSNIIGFQFLVWLIVSNKYYWRFHPIKRNHENIHFVQGKELLFIGLWILYILNYLINLFVFNFNRKLAYKNIIFEKEAYSMEKSLNYLSKRKPYSFIKWLT